MEFCLDPENEGMFWVDRNQQGHVDHFEPCGYCSQLIEMTPMQPNEWRAAGLCDPCLERLDLTARLDNAHSDRPWDLDTYVREIIREQELIIKAPLEAFRQPEIYQQTDLYNMY